MLKCVSWSSCRLFLLMLWLLVAISLNPSWHLIVFLFGETFKAVCAVIRSFKTQTIQVVLDSYLDSEERASPILAVWVDCGIFIYILGCMKNVLHVCTVDADGWDGNTWWWKPQTSLTDMSTMFCDSELIVMM